MSFNVRDGRFDVIVAAGPRVDLWPSAGVRAISTICAEMGLTAGVFGGESLTVRGIIPMPSTGGMVVVEDPQRRIHRLHARAVVRLSVDPMLPDPFAGWRSPGLVPLATALRLRAQSHVIWDPATVILGTGNRALIFGSQLLESGVPEVWCLESEPDWGAKRIAGWEVNRRRFEMAGGRIVEARPVRLSAKAPLVWELTIADRNGVERTLDVARVVSAGPFGVSGNLREHASGVLFELEQTAAATRDRDVEGWVLEVESARLLAARIVRSLVADLGPRRDEIERIQKRARLKLRRHYRHREEPFTPAWAGKWLALPDARAVRQYPGVPQSLQLLAQAPSIECFEKIPCNQCARACPVDAIEISRPFADARDNREPVGEGEAPQARLLEDRCVSCGICVVACPSSAISLLREPAGKASAELTLPWRGKIPWKKGDSAILINRRGDELGRARVIDLPETPIDLTPPHDVAQLVRVEVPAHLLMEARALKHPRPEAVADEAFFTAIERSASARAKVEITFNGERRLVRDKVPVSVALFETGHARTRDILLCPDGSCGLCQVEIDGVRKFACQTPIHRGMAIRFEKPVGWESDALCPCQGTTADDVVARLEQGDLRSPEAVLSVCGVGEGRCHGQLCMGSFKRLLTDRGLDASGWIDWRFPWSEWDLKEG